MTDLAPHRRTASRRFWLSLSAGLIFAIWALATPIDPVNAQPPPSGDKKAQYKEGGPNKRRYRQGPLRANEFLGRPKEDSPLDAYTFVAMRYTYSYRFRRTRTGVFIRATRVGVFAVFEPEKSWMRGEVGRRLLAHEQGPFDLLQIHVLRSQNEFSKQLGKFTATAASQEAAIRALKEKLDASMEKAHAKCAAAQEEYDYQTKNGRQDDAQKLHRRKQKEELERLTKENSGGSGGKRDSSRR